MTLTQIGHQGLWQISICFEQIGLIAGEDVAGYGETGMWSRCRKKC
ncbi:MAG: hypothetical protein IJK84_08920 [Bacteroidales bacterium]|nr:hypothetical protein [Bacteroidales bacterium]